MTTPDPHPTLFPVPEDWWVRRRCVVCGGALSLDFAHTYVVQRQCWIKIGATNKPRRRLGELARPAWRRHILYPVGMDWHEPLVVHAVLDGDIEHEMHKAFARFHAEGEWFVLSPTINEWIKEVTHACEQGPTPA